jgi:anthranilate phosphoribosyltransferase
MVVHGMDGLDEISLSGPTKISHLSDGEVTTALFDPSQVGVKCSSLEDIKGGTAADNARHLLEVLEGAPDPRRDVTLLNAAAALIVAGKARDFTEGLEHAAQAVDSGRAREKLKEYLDFTNRQ